MDKFDFYLVISSVYFPDEVHTLAHHAGGDQFGPPGSSWDIERHPDGYTVLSFVVEDDMLKFQEYWKRLIQPPIQVLSRPR